MQIFLDCDGVLADFETPGTALFGEHPRDAEARFGQDYTRARLAAAPDFFGSLPLLPDARALYEGVRALYPAITPIILTAVPPGTWAQPQKLAWRDRHFPGISMLTCRAKEKCLHGKPGDILIDDWPKYKHLWEEMGGVFILHTSAADSLAQLRVIQNLRERVEVSRCVEEMMRHGDPRSYEYRLGACDLLHRRALGLPFPQRYRMGSVQADAYWAGVDRGWHIWRELNEQAKAEPARLSEAS